jgi:uncharacterized protein (DUF736 family)
MGPLARRLLYLALSMSLSGCIIPTQFTSAEQTPNYRPTIVASLVKPALGQLNRSQTDFEEFDIVAEDPNLDDLLKARLFKQVSSTSPRIYTGDEIPLDFPSVPDAMNPTRRSGNFPSLSDCGLLGGSGHTDIFVVVADREFSNEVGHESTTSGGLTDEKYWDLICP